MNWNSSYLLVFLFLFFACETPQTGTIETEEPLPESTGVSSFWKNATVYFLLTDRFNNGDPGNDNSFDRKNDGAVLRSFEGGDLKGITQKIKEGYFNKLGVDAIWMTPVIEQIKGHTDEGTGKTYAYHGYWARDWTKMDPNFGSEAEFKEMIETAHANGIRILMDVVINHTGPVTDTDGQWPDSWVRTEPTCKYTDLKTTVECTLVENLPDIRTESDEAVELPEFLKEKWTEEGRLEEELSSLEAFFERTGHPRAPRFYIMKWLTDWIRKYGIDGFRVDTVKHTEAEIWDELKKECIAAFKDWKEKNPNRKLDDQDFYMVGEVYGFGLGGGKGYNYGDQVVDFYDNGFESLINFAFKADAHMSYDSLFAKYSQSLNGGGLDDVSILNYASSHDDGSPFDRDRNRSMEVATKLMLCPGGVQIYYGDESARTLVVDGANGDANLRSFMNWEDIDANEETQALLQHWQKLGQFRQNHHSVGAGKHEQLQENPYIFRRTLEDSENSDKVVVALDMDSGVKTVAVNNTFEDGTEVKDYYSGQMVKVESGQVTIDSPFDVVLLGKSK